MNLDQEAARRQALIAAMKAKRDEECAVSNARCADYVAMRDKIEAERAAIPVGGAMCIGNAIECWEKHLNGIHRQKG